MTLDAVRQLYNARPFTPFNIVLTDGQRLAVHHPEFLGAFPSGRTVMVLGQNDSFTVVDLTLVTALEVIRAAV